MTTVSVAMCTYNGSRFLSDQLQSIARQTHPPAEVVICDDGSTDSTLALLDSFAAAAPFPVHVHRNPTRLGVPANFSRAVSLCTATVIALCDQDDVWLPTKLERQVGVFGHDAAVGAVFSDANLVDESLAPLDRTLFQANRFSRRRRRRFTNGHQLEVLLAQPVVCGATLALRRTCLDLLLPFPQTGAHDLWISVLLGATNDLAFVPETLVRYRQHGANQIGAASKGPARKLARRQVNGVFGDEIGHYRAMVERLVTRGPTGSDAAISRLEEKIAHLQFRDGLGSGRLGPIVSELGRGRYFRYSRGLESAAYDLFFRSHRPPVPSSRDR